MGQVRRVTGKKGLGAVNPLMRVGVWAHVRMNRVRAAVHKDVEQRNDGQEGGG